MPMVNGQEVSPDDAVKRGLCPECARPLAEVNIEEHIAAHWPRERSLEAARRVELLKSYAHKQAQAKADEEK